jgi:hypothetical protein
LPKQSTMNPVVPPEWPLSLFGNSKHLTRLVSGELSR